MQRPPFNVKTLFFSLAVFLPLQSGANGLQQEAPGKATDIPTLGSRPAYQDLKCKDIVIGASAPDKELAYVRAVGTAVEQGGHSAKDLLHTMPDEFLWWIRLMGAISIDSVGMAVHETSHTVSQRFTNCSKGRASFYFDGTRWNTEYRSAGSPPYAAAASYVPDELKQSPLGRYQNYFVRLGLNPANDFRALLDEFNAHVEGARVEVKAIGSPLHTRFVGIDSYDGNLGGAADFMVFTLAYLKKARLEHPDVWQAIHDSPLLLAHIQRLWSGAENLFGQWKASGDTKYNVSKRVLEIAYRRDLIAELDHLGIQHKPSSPLSNP